MGKMLSRFPSEKLTLHKSDGTMVADVLALVEPKQIMVDDASLRIEEGDCFERLLPSGAVEYYLVTERGFMTEFGSIPAHFQTQVRKISKEEMLNMSAVIKPRKLFISHSSEDQKYVKAFVELLEDIGVPEESFVCTSVPGYGVPGGMRIYDWLRLQFVACDLRVIYILSHNYYKSPASLNEMGAAWVTKKEDTLVLLPGFSFSEIKGCIDPTEIGIKLDGDEEELKHRLNEFKDCILSEFLLPKISPTRWERHRDAFIQKTKDIAKCEPIDCELSATNQATDYSEPLMTLEACVVLLYAAENDGEIVVSRSLSGSTYLVGNKYNMNSSQDNRELAKWDAAIKALFDHGYIKRIKANNSLEIYRVTLSGYDIADAFKTQNNIDTSKSPSEIIEWMSE